MLSVTLSIIVVNSIFATIKSPVKAIMYADDLTILLGGENINKIANQLQKTID